MRLWKGCTGKIVVQLGTKEWTRFGCSFVLVALFSSLTWAFVFCVIVMFIHNRSDIERSDISINVFWYLLSLSYGDAEGNLSVMYSDFVASCFIISLCVFPLYLSLSLSPPLFPLPQCSRCYSPILTVRCIGPLTVLHYEGKLICARSV